MSVFKRIALMKPIVGQTQMMSKRFFGAAAESAPEKYPLSLRALHWGIGGSFIGAFYTINAALRTQGEEKANLMRLHESFGATAALLIVPRLYIRATGVMPKHVPGNFVEHIGAIAGHWGLYAAAIFLPFSGVAMALLGGKGFNFWGAEVPGKSNVTPSDGKTIRALFLLHRDIGFLSELLTVVHIASIPYHWVRGHGNILTRII